MGTSRSTAELVGKINRLAKEIPKANAATVKNAATVGREILTAGAVGAGLTPGKPFPAETRQGKPAKATWRAKVSTKLNGSEPSALLAYSGPVHWVEGGTEEHMIVPRSQRTRMGRVAKKKGPNARQQAVASALFGAMAGQGGAGEAARGVMKLPQGKGDNTSGIVRGAVKHPGRPARPFWQATKRKAIEATKRTAEATHSRALLEIFK